MLSDGTLASRSGDQLVMIWNTLSKKCLKTFKVFFTCISKIIPYNSAIILVMYATDIFLCDFQTEKVKILASKKGMNSYKDCLKLRNGEIAAVDGEMITIHSLYDEKPTLELKGHDKNINTIAQLKSGLLASGAQDCTVRLWNPLTGACCQVLVGHSSMVMKVFAFDNGDLGTCSNKMIVYKPIDESSS